MTVEYLLGGFVIEQVADVAEIFSESDLALSARLLGCLHCGTAVAFDLLYVPSIESVRFNRTTFLF